MSYYRLNIYMLIEHEYEKEEIYFFRTKQEAEDFKSKYDEDHKGEDGSYIPNINFIEYDIDEVSYEEMKREITVSQFEKMFNMTL